MTIVIEFNVVWQAWQTVNEHLALPSLLPLQVELVESGATTLTEYQKLLTRIKLDTIGKTEEFSNYKFITFYTFHHLMPLTSTSVS